MPVGTLGVGKSTFMNRVLGVADAKSREDKTAFYTEFCPDGVTQGFSVIQTNNLNIIDSPGLNDPKMSLATWSTNLNNSLLLGKPVSLAIMVMMCKVRPDVGDKQNALVL